MEGWPTYATICRLCLKKNGYMFGIFNQNNGKDKSLYKMIVDCTALQISMNDGLPNVICHHCLFKIEFCLEFRQQCFFSDATLRRVNNNRSTNATEVDPDLFCPQPQLPFYNNNDATNSEDVVMVVDPNCLDYNSDVAVEPENGEIPSENDNPSVKNAYGFSNISMCRICDYAFTNKEECAAHEEVAHNTDTPYGCVPCGVNFENRMHYLTHMKNVHQDDKPFKCPQCSRTFARRSDLRKHTIVHTGIKPFSCKVCSKSFSRNTNLSKHMRIHSSHKLFSCRKCHKKFVSKAELAKHSVFHSKARNKKTSNVQTKTTDLEETKVEEENDIQSFKDEQNDLVENADAPSENMVISIDPFDRDDGELSDASKVSDHNTDYERIMSSLVQLEDFNRSLVDDEKKNLRPFVCETCNKSFIRKRELDRHMVTHSGMKPFKCTKCDKSFGRKDKLVRHTRIHDADKQFNCDICEETFSRKENLIQHQKTYHVQVDNEVY